MEGFPMNKNFFGFSIIRRGTTTHSCLGCKSDCRTCIFKGFGDRIKIAAVRRWSRANELPKGTGQQHELNNEAIFLIFRN
jgi:hypothetical protein